MLTPADWAILAVVVSSGILSLWRGFLREAISLGAWVGAFVVAGKFYSPLAAKLTYFQDGITRNSAAIFILFVVTLLLIGTCGNILRSLVKKAGLSGTDRLLGVAFGVLRGVLVVCAVLAILQIGFKFGVLSFLMSNPVYADSLFIPELQRIVNWFFVYLSTPLNSLTSGA